MSEDLTGPHWLSQPDNRWSILKNGDPELIKELRLALRVRPKQYYFDPRFRIGIWDGWEVFYDLSDNKIPTGLIDFSRKLGFDIPEVILATDPLAIHGGWRHIVPLVNPSPDVPEGTMITPMSYQLESMEEIWIGARRGIFAHLTAAGKSVQIALICKSAPDLRILVSVPTIGLLKQLADDLEIMLQEDVGRLGSKHRDWDKRVTVVYNGLIKKLERTPAVMNLAMQTELLMVDELQTSTKLDHAFYRKCKNAYYRYGFSGSFFDIDPARIFSTAGFFGGVITEVNDEDTLEAGRTVPPHFTFYEFYIKKTEWLDYGDAYTEEIVKNKGYNSFFADIVAKLGKEGKSILVMVKRVDHCRVFQEALAERGLDSMIYNGRISHESRNDMKQEFSSGESTILIATEQTVGIGTNIPRIEVLANLGGGDSANSSKQKYGRSLRSFSFIGKESVEIVEPYITGNKWFSKHAKHRMDVAKKYKTGSVKLVHLAGHVEICV